MFSAGEILVPDTATPGEHVLSADEAWRTYAQLKGSTQTATPSQVNAAFGRLTFQHWNGVSVYAFTYESACVYTGLLMPSGQPQPSRPKDCTDWTFLDATSGSLIESFGVPVRH